MMKLDQDRFGGHLPVHPKWSRGGGILCLDFDVLAGKKPLPLRPDRPGGIERLEFDSDKIDRLAVTNGDQAIVDTTPGNNQLTYDAKLISGFVQGEQMDAINEDLAPFEQAKGTDND